MSVRTTALLMKDLIQQKEFFLYPLRTPENIFDIVLHKQLWLDHYFLDFISGDFFLQQSMEYQQSLIYNLYSQIKLKNKFKRLSFYKIILLERTKTPQDIEQLHRLYDWAQKEKIHLHLILLELPSLKIHSLLSDFQDKEGIVDFIEHKLYDINEDPTQEINLLEIEQTTKQDKGYYFSTKKHYFTNILTAINILVFLYMSSKGSTTDIYNLIQFGAKYNPLIAVGEYYRLFTNMFIHIGVAHLILNTYALRALGKDVEAIYGSYKFIIIYIVAGIFGSLGSFLFSKAVSAGASGAIFGLIGAYLFFGIRRPAIFSARYGMNIILMLVINIVFGLTSSNIDNFAHFGGLLGGLLACWALGLGQESTFKKSRVLTQLLILILIFSLTFTGVHIHQQTWEYNLHKGIRYLQKNELYEAKIQFETGLEKNSNSSEFYFYLAYIYYYEGDKNIAIEYLEKALALNPQDDMARLLLSEIMRQQG